METTKSTDENKGLLHLLNEQRDIISMMQIQLDMQKERIDCQEKLLTELKAEVSNLKKITEGKKTEGGSSFKENNSDWKGITNADEASQIADMVKKAAEETLAQQTNYKFDSKTGLYFDEASGYYWDPAQELFYNGHTRTYYKYDQDSGAYVFHSQLPETETKPKESKKKRASKSRKHKKTKISESTSSNSTADPTASLDNAAPSSDAEEGELSDSEKSSDSSGSGDTDTETVKSQKSSSQSTTSSRCREELLPCIRAIVLESTLPELRKGYLFIVTCMGGSIGREGDTHCILIPDLLISKHHADIHYSSEDGKYYLTDLGSQNGTFLNGSRLSDAKVASEAHEVLHGSTVKVGNTTLLVHIHPGSLTCAMCEPGLIPTTKEPIYGTTTLTKENKEKLRKKQLRQLRKKYCVAQEESTKLPDSYTDRALERRAVKGSDNPFEKTQVASVHEAIKEDNKGFQMLSKMGWNSGTSLGRSPAPPLQTPSSISSGPILEPINVELRPERVGLGFFPGMSVPSSSSKNSSSSSFTAATPTPPTTDSLPTSRQKMVFKGQSTSKNRAAIAEKTRKRFINSPVTKDSLYTENPHESTSTDDVQEN